MDDQQKNDNQDLTMNMDGTMTTDQGQKIEVTSAPVVNDIEPPAIGETEIKAESDDEEVANDGVVATPEQSDTAGPVQSEPQEIVVAEENTSAEPQSPPEESSSPEPTTPQETTPTENAAEDQALAEVGVAMSQTRDKSQHVHRNNKKVALVVTLVTAVLLAGLAVYVYLSANNAAEPTTSNTNNQSQTTTETAATPATPEDVDTATQELDSAIDSVDTAADFDESELSDQSLGL